MKNSMSLSLAALLFTISSPVFAMCVDDAVDMAIELNTPESIHKFVEADTKVTELKASESDAHKFASVRLKDSSCIVKAIQSFDSTKYQVLKVQPFLSGRSYSDGHFESNGKKLTLLIDVGDKNTPLMTQVSTKIQYYMSGYPYNGSGLRSTSEYIDCDIE